jgi:hypothetical protein
MGLVIVRDGQYSQNTITIVFRFSPLVRKSRRYKNNVINRPLYLNLDIIEVYIRGTTCLSSRASLALLSPTPLI